MHAEATYKYGDERSCEHGKGKVEAADEGKIESRGRGEAVIV
jgi:hypothetical protein